MEIYQEIEIRNWIQKEITFQIDSECKKTMSSQKAITKRIGLSSNPTRKISLKTILNAINSKKIKKTRSWRQTGSVRLLSTQSVSRPTIKSIPAPRGPSQRAAASKGQGFFLREEKRRMGIEEVKSRDSVVIKSPTDHRLYRILHLPNGLCALLVHDPEIYPHGYEQHLEDSKTLEDDAMEEDEDDEDDGEDELDEDESEEEDEEEDDEEEATETKKRGRGAAPTKKVIFISD